MPPKSEPSPRPTLKSVAEAVGLSTAAVSMALRGLPAVSPATRRRVEQAAARIGYRADPTLGRLMGYLRQGRQRPTATIAMLTVREQPAPWRNNPYLRRYYQPAVERAEQLGFRIEELWLGQPRLTSKRMKEMLLARGIEGLFVFSGQGWSRYADFDFSPFACATYGRWSGKQSEMDRATSNYYLNMRTAIRRLLELGYRRIGVALETEFDERTAHLYSSAYVWEQYSGRIAGGIPLLLENAITEAPFRAWFKRHRPDAVIAQSPPCRDYLRWFENLGVSVPDEVGFVTLDVDPGDPLRPSGLRENSARISSAVVDMIATQINRGERGLSGSPRILMFEGDWIDGSTTRPPKSGG